MAKNLGKVTIGGACGAKSMSEDSSLMQSPWVIYNPDSENFKVLYSVHGELSADNEFYGNEFANCSGGDTYREISGETYCDGYDKYVDVYSQVSHDGGSTWETTATTKTLVEKDSTDCGYVAEARVVCTYNVGHDGEEIKLFEGGGSGSGSGSGSGGEPPFSSMEIDGVEQSEVVNKYTFDTAGEHTVKFTLVDPTTIGDSAFTYCYNLKTIDIPSGVTSIGSNTFYECTRLESIVIPNSVTSIGYSAFFNCTSLESIDIPSGVTSIGYEAFYDCTSLESIDIPSGVTSIGYSAFYNCTSLESIDIPSGVTSIGGATFQGCTSLTSVTIPNGVTSIGGSAFAGCSSLTSVTISDNVISIGNYAFNNCTGLTSIVIPDSVTSIDYNTFSNCTSLTSATIGSGVTKIGQSVFRNCTSLVSVNIPNSITSIGYEAFYDCTNLSNITSNATTAPTIQSGTFYNVKRNGILYVPIGSSGYDVWMQNANYYLGSYSWTKVEQ